MWHYRWFNNQLPSFSPVLHCPLGLGELLACPFPDVVFPSPFLSALSSSPFHCALHDDFGQTWWTGDMSIPLQFVSLYNGQVFVWSDCLLDLGTNFLIANTFFFFFLWGVVSCGSTSFTRLVVPATKQGKITKAHHQCTLQHLQRTSWAFIPWIIWWRLRINTHEGQT